MSNSIEMEIVRLIQEIEEDEKELVRAEKFGLKSKTEIYTKAIERKIKLLEILKK